MEDFVGLSDRDLRTMVDTLVAMEEMESAVSILYKECADKWPSNREFWNRLADEEMHHAENIEMMRTIISQKPREFEKGRPFNIVATRTAIQGIRHDTDQIKAGDIQEEKALHIALDIENSFIESRYAEILKTSNTEYMNLVEQVSHESQVHRSRILKKIQA